MLMHLDLDACNVESAMGGVAATHASVTALLRRRSTLCSDARNSLKSCYKELIKSLE